LKHVAERPQGPAERALGRKRNDEREAAARRLAGSVGDLARQAAEELDGERVCEVGIIDHQERRPGGRGGEEDLAEAFEEEPPVARLLPGPHRLLGWPAAEETPSGTPYEFERFEINNDSGFLVGAAVISLSDTDDVLPPNQDIHVLDFRLLIDPGAGPGETPLEFEDGGQGTGGPVRKKLVAGGEEITPDSASTFIFVNARVAIVPDGTPFARGDSNQDSTVNVSDPHFTLNYLFLGGEEPACLDAVDAVDDGQTTITDAVFTLNWLVLGGPEPGHPGPRGCGIDPTPTDLLKLCLYHPPGGC
jgi:hypothetical protein